MLLCYWCCFLGLLRNLLDAFVFVFTAAVCVWDVVCTWAHGGVVCVVAAHVLLLDAGSCAVTACSDAFVAVILSLSLPVF